MAERHLGRDLLLVDAAAVGAAVVEQEQGTCDRARETGRKQKSQVLKAGT